MSSVCLLLTRWANGFSDLVSIFQSKGRMVLIKYSIIIYFLENQTCSYRQHMVLA